MSARGALSNGNVQARQSIPVTYTIWAVGENVMAEHNYPCDSFIKAYFGALSDVYPFALRCLGSQSTGAYFTRLEGLWGACAGPKAH